MFYCIACMCIGTYHCCTRHVKDVLKCLGGIKVLFPFFSQLDQPTLKLKARRSPSLNLSSTENALEPSRVSVKSSGLRPKIRRGSESEALRLEGTNDLTVITRDELSYDIDPSFLVNILEVQTT